MRLPGRSELSAEQERIFLEAPMDGAVLVSGPPGTGKTVLAIMRALMLRKMNRDFALIMFNKVLVSYTKLALEKAGLERNVRTWHSWIYNWWFQAAGRPMPSQKRFEYDFNEALKAVMQGDLKHPERLNWGHLILDEGQDFPPGFYDLVGYQLLMRKAQDGRVPAITVLADHHQRLEEERHSTIQDISRRLGIPPEKFYQLTANFRNTYEIAALVRCFFTGSPEKLPDLPESRRGKIPELRRFDSLEEEARFIANYAKNNDDQDIGVFVSSANDQMELFRMLEGPLRGSRLSLQMYASRHPDWKDASRLVFGSQGSITLLTDKSCKGLEFDAVFVPQLNKYRITGVEEEFMKMKLYVMASRARSYLAFSYSNSVNEPGVLKLLPSEDEGLMKWKN
ncbi:DNA/RNA helicase domain-containing protein [Shewanella algae]|uniref:DNA/RNA helicase domain-containing protein n=1 Tax=Shewanella algae TaxID=38313 RepID=UPI001AACE4E3|nr:DNA/RNA helicase domain-containing protein [Shewanella algae]QTE80907.1 AAA family ATPase [Shewanella algae]